MTQKTTVKTTLRQLGAENQHLLIIPESVEKTIRTLCALSPTNEWSGILFYTFEGSFETSLTLTCKDILPLHQGSSVYTEFNTSNPKIARYMFDNDLLRCCIGLVHSHGTMKTFFSGTDTNTLLQEGSDTNSFLSLIVNNAGEYTAAITRKVTSEIEEYVERHSKKHYNVFNTDEKVELSDSRSDYTRNFEDIEVEYVYLNIQKPDNIFADSAVSMFYDVMIATKIAEPKKVDVMDWNTPVKAQKAPKQLSLFPKEDDDMIIPSKKLNAILEEEDYSIEEIAALINWDSKQYCLLLERMFTGTPLIKAQKYNTVKEELQYLKTTIVPKYAEIFENQKDFTEWVKMTTDYFLYEPMHVGWITPYIESTAGDAAYILFDETSIVAYKTAEFLKPFASNRYIQIFVEILESKI